MLKALRTITPGSLSLSPSLPSPSWSGNQLIVVDVSGLGWLAESHVFQEDDKRPSGAGGKGRPGGNEVPADAWVTGRRFRFFFPLINIGWRAAEPKGQIISNETIVSSNIELKLNYHK